MSDLDRFHDGLLGSAEESEFRKRLDSEPALGAELARQRAVDAHLTAAFTPPDAAAITRAALARSVAAAPRAETKGFPWLAAAGYLLAAGLVLWAARGSGVPADDARIAALYKDATAGYEPGFSILACSSPGDSRDRVVEHFGQGLLIVFDVQHPVTEPDPDVCTIVGASPAYIVGGAEHPIVVLVESALAPPLPAASGEAGVHVHRTRVGDCLLYELSPYPEPRALDLFRVAPGDH